MKIAELTSNIIITLKIYSSLFTCNIYSIYVYIGYLCKICMHGSGRNQTHIARNSGQRGRTWKAQPRLAKSHKNIPAPTGEGLYSSTYSPSGYAPFRNRLHKILGDWIDELHDLFCFWSGICLVSSFFTSKTRVECWIRALTFFNGRLLADRTHSGILIYTHDMADCHASVNSARSVTRASQRFSPDQRTPARPNRVLTLRDRFLSLWWSINYNLISYANRSSRIHFLWRWSVQREFLSLFCHCFRRSASGK
jgi:hypothetical protein